MAILQKIKEKLGFGDDSPEDGNGETEVTVERESNRDVGGTDVGGADVGESGAERSGGTASKRTGDAAASGTEASASTDSLVEEKEKPEGAAEPGEAAGPESDDVTIDMDEAEEAAADDSDADFDEESAEETVDESVDESAASGTEASASTGSMTEEPSAADAAAEPAEAAGPGTDDIAIDPDEGADDEESVIEDAEVMDATTEGDPVDSIRGIGPAYAERLAAIGIDTVSDLAAADAAEVAEGASVGEKRAGEWIDRAQSFDSAKSS